MNDRDLKYDRMDGERLYGRGELLDVVMHELAESCTIFGFDGVSGIGKSEVAARFATTASEGDAFAIIRVNISDHAAQEQLIAALYTNLQEIPKSFSEKSGELATAILEKAPGGVRRVLAGAMQDVMKKVNKHLEHTIDAIAKELSGEHEETSTGAHLSKISESNQRYFIREFMTFVADMGRPVILLFDNYEDAESSAQDFLNWLLTAKPASWVIVVVANLEKLTHTDWQRRMAPSIKLHSGALHRVDAPSRQVISEWFEDELKHRPTEEELDQAIAYTNQGRPVWLRRYFSASARGEKLPKVADLTALFTVRRTSFDPAARSIAELMAFALPDARIPRDWVEAAAAIHGIPHIGGALDALLASSEIVETEGKLSFYNSSYRESWYRGLAKPDLLKIQMAWYSVYRASVDAMTSFPGAGILPNLALEIAAHDDGTSITRVASDLIQSGSVNTALAIVDASWQTGGRMDSPGPDVIEHALIAAQARLDVGRYREAHEALQMIARHTGRDGQQTIRADLLGLKLALRQNAYTMVWRLSSKLQKEAADDNRIQLSRELVVNTAYRDLCRKSEISDSVARIAQFVDEAPAEDRAKAERSLARSLAKLGRTDEAITAATSALALAEQEGDVREIANANLAMAESLRYSGRLDEAVTAYREAETLARGVGNRDSEIWSILGRACAHLQAGDLDAAESALNSVSKLVNSPGFEHPLESAHVAMINLILNSLRGQPTDPTGTLRLYRDIGIDWPDAFIGEVTSTHSIGVPIPI